MGKHIFSALCTVVMMWMVVRASLHSGSTTALVSNIVYMTTGFVMFVELVTYHRWPKGMPKQVMQVVDYCGIFFTIAALKRIQ